MWELVAREQTIDTPLLIADGHHRYETAVAYREENPAATHTFAVLVSSRAPGLEIFPTHRLVQAVGDVPGEEVDGPGHGVTLYRDGRYPRVRPRTTSARASSSRSRRRVWATRQTPTRRSLPSTAARLRRVPAAAVTTEQVARFASAGEVMPQKSTFFFRSSPQALFHPVG
jgi:hypothetical protein